MFKGKIWKVVAIVTFSVFAGLAILLLRKWFSTPKPIPEQGTTIQELPLLEPQLQQTGFKIQELDGPTTRTYILPVTIVKPFYQVPPFLKADVTINGDPTQTVIAINLGTLPKPLFFGQGPTGNQTWRWVKVEQLPELIGNNQQLVIYLDLPKDKSDTSLTSQQKQAYDLITKLAAGDAPNIAVKEIVVGQLGVAQ